MGNSGSRRDVGPSPSQDSYGTHPARGDGILPPGSPLTYSVQVPMEPLNTQPEQKAIGERSNYSYTDIPAGLSTHSPVFPTVIYWSHGGEHVEVEGSFDNWATRQTLQRSGKDFTIVKLLPPGVYQYKFIVDGEWKYAPELPAMRDEIGNVNNVLEVQEYAPDEYTRIQGFEPPPSPPESYDCAQGAMDESKPPPPMPVHLNLTLLNVSAPVHDDNKSLPRPQHVILDHLYCQNVGQNVTAVVMGTTWRYRSKYVTSVMYKPVGGQRGD